MAYPVRSNINTIELGYDRTRYCSNEGLIMEVAMNAMRAAALPHYHAGSARPRPHLRVVHSAGSPETTRPEPVTPEPVTPEPVTPEQGRLEAAAPETARRLAPSRPVVSRPVVSRPEPSPLRLTRRGRVVVAAAAALLVVVVSLVAAGAAQAISHSASGGAAGRGLAQVVVRPGESLWSVAETADPDADTRVVIQRIVEMNSLPGDTVFAGQRLWVPRG
jgi:hypothetical protein